MIDEDEVEDRAANWAVIAQAEGVLAARRGITVVEAARALRVDTDSSGRRLSEVARNIVTPAPPRSSGPGTPPDRGGDGRAGG